MFNNWKLYILSVALIGALSLNVAQRFRLGEIENDVIVCQGKLAVQTVAINFANQQRAEQEKKLRLTEQEAARARAESQKRTESIMLETVNGGCEGAIQYGIKQAPIILFYWSNNIP